MANVSGLKPGKAAGPPPATEAPRNTKIPARDKQEPKTTIEFSVPESIAEDFRRMAGEAFGHKKGAKSLLFLKMFEDYRSRIS